MTNRMSPPIRPSSVPLAPDPGQVAEDRLGSLPAAPRTRVEHDIAPAAILKVVGTVLGLWLVVQVWPVLVLILLSLMLVATFNPLVRRLQARLNRTWAITAVMLGLVLLFAAMLGLMIPSLVRQAQNLITHLPEYARTVEAAAQRAGIPLEISAATANWTQRVASLGPKLLGVLSSVVSGVTGVLTVAVLSLYLLIDGPRIGTGIMRALPRTERLPARRMLQEIAEQVGGYMRGQLLTSTLAGVFTFVLLAALGVPEPLALAFLMAVMDAVPMIGPIIGTVPAVLLALTQGVPTAVAVTIGFLLYQQLENHVLVPRIYGNTMKLSSSVILIAILIGATLMGILGALLALPVAAAIPVLLRYVGEWQEREHEREAADAGTASPL